MDYQGIRSSSSLRHQVSESSMDMLELKSRMREKEEYLRNQLQKAEKDSLNFKVINRQLRLELQDERKKRSSVSSNENLRLTHLENRIMDIQNKCDIAVNAASESERKSTIEASKYRSEIASKNSKINQYQRQVEALENRVDRESDKVKGVEQTVSLLKQENSNLKSDMEEAHAQLRMHQGRAYRQREQEQEDQMEIAKLREERDRAVSSATEYKRSLERTFNQLNQEKLHSAAIQQEFHNATKQIVQNDDKQRYKEQFQKLQQQMTQQLSSIESYKDELKATRSKYEALKEHVVHAPNYSGSELQSKYSELVQLTAKLEWEKVDVEKRFFEQKSLNENLVVQVNELEDQVSYLKMQLKESEECLEFVRLENEQMVLALSDIQIQLQAKETEFTEFKANCSKELQLELNLLSQEIHLYVRVVNQLVQLMNACLNGEEPSIDMLLDDATTTAAIPMDILDSVVSSKAAVSSLRSVLADKYAENIASDCQVQ